MLSAESWLVRRARVEGRELDCRLRDGVIAEVGFGLSPGSGDRVLDARGGALLPGLADHHIHLRATAAARRSVDLSGGDLTSSAAAASSAGNGWLRVVGAGRELVRGDVDAVWSDRPVRVQHRSGALWTLNSAAVARLRPGASAQEKETGQFWRAGDRLRELIGLESANDVAALCEELLSYGVTHVTDTTPELDPATIDVPMHLLSLSRLGTGPRKIVVADHTHPDLDQLADAIGQEHDRGRGVALHVVSAAALAVALAAWTKAGVRSDDRIEHAAVCSDDAALQLAELDLTVVTQPTLFARHGADYLADSEPHERPLLWRYGGLLRAGVRVVVSSDAPYGDPNPWATIRAAATRGGQGGPIASAEQVAPEISLASMFSTLEAPGRGVRRVEVGAAADLCLLDVDLPLALARAVDGGVSSVAATFVSGRRLFFRGAG